VVDKRLDKCADLKLGGVAEFGEVGDVLFEVGRLGGAGGCRRCVHLGLLDDQVVLLSQPGVLGLELRHPLVHCLHRTRYPVDEVVDFVFVVSGGEAAGLVKRDGL
jgi:hypothetical protein